MLHSLLSICVVALAVVSASPIAERQLGCSEKLQRKAWHTLSSAEKTTYLNAELCLMWQRPTKLSYPSSKSRFDDLVKAHQLQSGIVHGDAYFLPFHRLQMFAHEKLLREECGYTGAQPYWDEAKDAGRFTASEIFDPVVGFGGDGVGSSRCIADGPFANYTLHTGPGTQNTEHCIQRRVSDSSSRGSSQANIDNCLAMDTYARGWPCIEARPHSGGHSGVGGEMLNPISSPGDPLFYMHHTFLDRVWHQWQMKDPEKRLYDLSGFTTQRRPSTGWKNATLDDTLNMFDIIGNATVREVMDIGGDLLCFEYV